MGACISSKPQPIEISAKDMGEARRKLESILSTIEPLNLLSDFLIEELLVKSVVLEYTPKQVIYKSKAEADAFYVVMKGSCTTADKSVILQDELFGHVEILQGFPRLKTVVAGRQGCILRRISAEDYRLAAEKRLSTLDTNVYRVLLETPVFSGLTERELMHLKNMVFLKSFAPGKVIISKGDAEATEMYIIESGAAIVSDYTDDSTILSIASAGMIPSNLVPKEITLQSRGYFGEEALLVDDDDGSEPRTRGATVRAGEEGCAVLVLSKEVFNKVLKKIKHRFYRNIIARDAEFAALVERGEKLNCEIDHLAWNLRSGTTPASKSNTPSNGAVAVRDSEEEDIKVVRRRADHASRRLSRVDLDAAAKRRAVASKTSDDPEKSEGWLQPLTCGIVF